MHEADSPQKLTKFGLTINEAKAWFEQEPNYKPADEKKQHFKTDEEVPEPDFLNLICFTI